MGNLHVTEVKSRRTSIYARTTDRTVYYIESEDGNITHRPNGPAIVMDNGTWGWKFLGEFHRYYGTQNNRDPRGWWIHGIKIKDN